MIRVLICVIYLFKENMSKTSIIIVHNDMKIYHLHGISMIPFHCDVCRISYTERKQTLL